MRDPFCIERTATDDGLMWRAEIIGDDLRLKDCTRWTSSPIRAIRDGQALIAGRYWAGDDQPYTTAA